MKSARQQTARSAGRQDNRDDVPGLAARRVATDMLDVVLRQHRPLDEQFDGAGANAELAGLPDRDRGARPRVGCDRAAPAWHAAPSDRPVSGARPAAAGAADRNRAADRRSTDPVPRCARPRGGRSFGPAGACGPRRRSLCRPGQRCAAAGRPRRRRASRCARCNHSRYPANGCWRAGSGLTARPTARAIAAANGKEPALDLTVKNDPESFAAQARRPRIADRNRSHHRARFGDSAAGLRRRRVVGTGCRGGAAGTPAWRRCRPARRRPVRGAGRQNRATRQCGRACDRSRSRTGAA